MKEEEKNDLEQEIISNRLGKSPYDEDDDDEEENNFGRLRTVKNNKKNNSKAESKTPTIDKYSKDLTVMASSNLLDPIVGRDKEVRRMCQILTRRKKNNPIIIGAAGVGKTSLFEKLAQKIAIRDVPESLLNKRVVLLDLTAIVAGSKYRGQFEERLNLIIEEATIDKSIILVIDEIHNLMGAGNASGSMDAANIIKPALSNGSIQVIGATSLDEYRKHIEKDTALERRFQKIQIEAASVDESIIILNNIKDKYEEHHKVSYTEEAIVACVNLTNRYLPDRMLPDKAIDALDEAGAYARMSLPMPDDEKTIYEKIGILRDLNEKLNIQKHIHVKESKYEKAAAVKNNIENNNIEIEKYTTLLTIMKSNRIISIDENIISDVVSSMSGIPVNKVQKNEKEKLKQMPDVLKGTVIGQDEAVLKICKAVQRSKVGLKDPNRPMGVFLANGSSGVGKSHLAKELAKYLFDSEDSMIRIDMSEYVDRVSVNRIIGAPSGYLGYDDSCLLDQIRNKPYSIILLDEIEKAHKDVFSLFLQMFDDGHITDSHGRRVSFKDCIIILTSNTGSRAVSEQGKGIGMSGLNKDIDNINDKSIIEKELKKTFAPEFLNRIDEIVHFNKLTKPDILKIINLELNKTIKKIETIGYSIEITDTLIEKLINDGYDVNYGARPLKRAIRRLVEEPLTDILLEEPELGTLLHINYDDTECKTIITY